MAPGTSSLRTHFWCSCHWPPDQAPSPNPACPQSHLSETPACHYSELLKPQPEPSSPRPAGVQPNKCSLHESLQPPHHPPPPPLSPPPQPWTPGAAGTQAPCPASPPPASSATRACVSRLPVTALHYSGFLCAPHPTPLSHVSPTPAPGGPESKDCKLLKE